MTPEEIAANVDAFCLRSLAIAEAIRALGTVPNGELYARVMAHLSHADYETIIDALQRQKLVTLKNHVLTWIGPATS